MGDAGCDPDLVRYGTAVRVRLPGLPAGVKRQVWRDRQIQDQAYNWGVEHALRAHYRGERVRSPRTHSQPLTEFRRETGSAHSSLLQRGGFWSAVDAVMKWSKRRNQLLYGQRKAAERVNAAFVKLDAAAGRCGSVDDAGLLSHVGAAADALMLYRDCQQRRVDLVDSGEGAALRLRTTPSGVELTQMTASERSDAINEVTEEVDEALAVVVSALKAASAAVKSAEGAEAVRKRLRELVGKVRAAAAAEAKADKKLLAHVAKGDRRLFRSRRDLERCSGSALVLFEGCAIRGGVLRLPGGTEIPLPVGGDTIDGILATHQDRNLTWSGAVHVVDVTDKAGKVTRRTQPEHRKYHVHFLCRAAVPAPAPVTSPKQSSGCDWGVAAPLVCSDGTAYARHSSPAQQQASRERHTGSVRLQQSMATKTDGSRRHTKQRRQRERLVAKNTNVRINTQRHIAKAVVTAPDVRQVVLEGTNVSNMTASAVGTKAFPTKGSGAKRGLNRSIAETAPARCHQSPTRCSGDPRCGAGGERGVIAAALTRIGCRGTLSP